MEKSNIDLFRNCIILLSIFLFFSIFFAFSYFVSANNVSLVNTTSTANVVYLSLPSGWSELISPPGIFEPYNPSLTGTHVNNFSIRFINLSINNDDVLLCYLRLSDGGNIIFNETGLNMLNENYSINYTIQENDSIIGDSKTGYIPWILKNCSIYSQGGTLLYNETKNSRIYVHDDVYWTDDEITRAVTCAGTPGVYFNNTGKCEFSTDTMFALQMRNGNPVEESCFNNPYAGCSNDYCRGIFFPTCKATEYFSGYNASMDDPNNYAVFNVDFSGYTVPVAYTLYTNTSSDGSFKLRVTQSLTSKPYSFTIYNLSYVDSVKTNIYGSNLGNGTLAVTDQGDGTFTVAYYNFDYYTGNLDFVFNVSFTNSTLEENRTLGLVIAFGTATNQQNPAYFEGRFSSLLGPKNNNESEITFATSVDYLGACSDRVNNDFDYLNSGFWDSSYDCYDSDCHLFWGDYNQTNEFGSGKIGLCNYLNELNCSDEFDNDYNDFTDCHDADCFHNGDGLNTCPTTELICNDLINNDWDYVNTESETNYKIGNDGWNGLKYAIGRTSPLIDCEDPDCDGQLGGLSGELCNWGYELTCNDGFNNDALQMKDCELTAVANSKDMPSVATAEYDCSSWCRANILNTETGALCDNNLDDDFDAVIVTGYYTGTANLAFGAGIDCRWLTYNPDEDCNLTILSSGARCELGHELTCNDMFDNDYDADGTASDHPSPGWNATTYNAIFGTYGLSYVQYADYDDYDCALSLPYAQNESLNASWCFDDIDNDMDMYYWDGGSWVLNTSTGIDCKDPDCMGVTNPLNPNQTCMEKEYDVSDPFFQNLAIPGMYCINDFDDDADIALGWPFGGKDCRDPDCNKQFDLCSDVYCYNTEAITWDSCSDGIDNDYDMPNPIIDCKDSDCFGMIGDLNGAICQSSETVCNDNFDNDEDGNTDCEESYCIDLVGGKINGINVYCRAVESSIGDCFDGFDNDADGNIDCYDSSCNSVCGLTDINGNNPISLPQYSGQITLNSIDSSTQARIDQSTEKIRDGENYNITFRGISASTNAQWTIGTATSRFDKTKFDISTAVLSGTNAGTFSLTQTANGWIVQSTSGHPGGYVVTFNVKSNGTFNPNSYELTYAENNGGLISLNNYLDYESVENIPPVAQLIEIIPNSGNLIQNNTVYLRANISDNYALGRCHFTVSGAETLDLGTSNNCRDSFNPINEGTYYVNITPIDYYGNIGISIQKQYDLNLIPKFLSISIDKIVNPFYNQSFENVILNATFDLIPGDSLGTCQAIAINSSNNEINLGTFASSGNSCYINNLDISSLNDGAYRLFVRVTETTDGDIVESESTALFVCSETTSGVCRFADYNSDSKPDVCDIVKNVTVNLLQPVDNYYANQSEINFSCYAESNNSLENITLYVWNNTGDIYYSDTNIISGTNATSYWVYSLLNGDYFWNCRAYNNLSQYGWSDVNRTINMNSSEDNIVPMVTLVSPSDGYSSNIKTVTFVYRVSDASDILNCDLFIDGNLKETDNTITKDINQQFITNLEIGVYSWKVVCYDAYNNQGNSSSRQITIRTTSAGGGDKIIKPIPSGPSASSKICWPESNNELVELNISRKDLAVEEIKFFYEGYAKEPCIIIEPISLDEILNKTNYKIENSYKSFNITTEGLDENKIKNISILTSINNSWILFRNLDSILLNRNTEIISEGWENYPVKLQNIDLEYYYFESKMINGFSKFLITGQLKVSPFCGNGVCEEHLGENAENCPEDCGEKCCFLGICTGFIICWYWWLLILLLILIIILLYIKKKKERVGV